MKKRDRWKKTMLISCLAGLLTAGGTLYLAPATAWALPSSAKSIEGNTVVRDDANGTPVGSLNEGQSMTIKDSKTGTDGYEWYAITFDFNGVQTEGWVRSDLVSTSGDDAAEGGQEQNAGEGGLAGTQPSTEDGIVFQAGNSNYRVAVEIPDDKIPEGFTKTTITYTGTSIPAAKFNNADLFLLYLENTTDRTDTRFFVYDSERDSIVPYVRETVGEGYVILTNVPTDQELLISGRYIRNNRVFDNGSVMAYQLQAADAATADGAPVEDFYYVYGVSSGGQSGWYVYDEADKTLQRSTANMQYVVPTSTPSAPEPQAKPQAIEFDMGSTIRMIVSVLAVLCLFFLILVIIFSTRYRRLRRRMEDGDFGDFDDEEDYEDFDDYEDEEFRGGGEQSGLGNLTEERPAAPAGKEEPKSAASAEKEASKQTAPAGKEASKQTDSAEKEASRQAAPAGKEPAKQAAPAGKEPAKQAASAGKESAKQAAPTGKEPPKPEEVLSGKTYEIEIPGEIGTVGLLDLDDDDTDYTGDGGYDYDIDIADGGADTDGDDADSDAETVNSDAGVVGGDADTIDLRAADAGIGSDTDVAAESDAASSEAADAGTSGEEPEFYDDDEPEFYDDEDEGDDGEEDPDIGREAAAREESSVKDAAQPAAQEPAAEKPAAQEPAKEAAQSEEEAQVDDIEFIW